jgi:nicotinamide-nucleotide amidase
MNPVHNAEILSVGTELLLGEIVDTNSAWLAAELAHRGVDVYWSQRVGDNLDRLVAAIEGALERSDLLLLTGGLGPTDDDMTREAIAAALGETPGVDPDLERELRARFATFARRMPERNLKQAWVIPSAEPLANPRGTAPGWLVRTRRNGRERLIAALPGPPREMRGMWTEQLLPRLTLPTSTLAVRTYKTHGIGESAVAERLGELTLNANPSVATYAKRDGVHVRVAAKAVEAEAAEALAAPVRAEVERLLGDSVWGRDDQTLPQLLLERLAALGSHVASVEAPGGGLVVELLSAAAAAGAPWSTAYRGGVVAWRHDAMATLGAAPLRARPATDADDDVVGMAEAVRTLFAADYGIASGDLEPEEDDAAAGAPAYSTTLALAGPAGSSSQVVRLPALGAAWLRERIGFAALHLLWRQLVQIQESAPPLGAAEAE